MGKATLELFDERQAEVIDQLEVGRRISGQVRFALQVPNLAAAIERLLAHDATLVHEPVLTPWGDTNARLQDPDGMQITLYQAPEQLEKDK
jgi:methylmalonyl-CoA/ethylmalonyl-CoA epimerase